MLFEHLGSWRLNPSAATLAGWKRLYTTVLDTSFLAQSYSPVCTDSLAGSST